MLRIIRGWNRKDYLRNLQSVRAYGIPIAPKYMPVQWQGAYTDENRAIVYFIARQIDTVNEVIYSYNLETNLIKYENDQYVWDNTKLYGGYLPDGCYFFEFNNGYETYFSQMFNVTDLDEFDSASSALPCSDADLVSSLNVPTPDLIVLKQFEKVFEYVQFE